MNYANRALNIFKDYDEYAVQTIRCQFIVAGNYIDSLEFEKALQVFLNSLNIAKSIKYDHLIGMSHINIGICFDELKQYKDAAHHLEKSLMFLEKSNNSFLSKALFILTHVKAKQNDIKVALTYFNKGQAFSKRNNDHEYIAKFRILEGLYFSNGEYHLIKDAFEYLLSRKMFADVENYAIEVGDYFFDQGNLLLSNEYYRMGINAKRKIKKGEIVCET